MGMEDFDYADYVSEERVIADEKLGKYNLPFILFPTLFYFLYVINFDAASFMEGMENFITLKNTFLIFSVGFLFHEMLHFLSWQGLSRFPIEAFRVGIRWNSITPVIVCQRPMKLWHFRIGLVTPFIVMGVIPMVFAFSLTNTWLLFASSIYMAWASGDLLTIILLWKVPTGSFVEMHRNKLGVIVFNPKQEILQEELIND